MANGVNDHGSDRGLGHAVNACMQAEAAQVDVTAHGSLSMPGRSSRRLTSRGGRDGSQQKQPESACLLSDCTAVFQAGPMQPCPCGLPMQVVPTYSFQQAALASASSPPDVHNSTCQARAQSGHQPALACQDGTGVSTCSHVSESSGCHAGPNQLPLRQHTRPTTSSWSGLSSHPHISLLLTALLTFTSLPAAVLAAAPAPPTANRSTLSTSPVTSPAGFLLQGLTDEVLGGPPTGSPLNKGTANSDPLLADAQGWAPPNARPDDLLNCLNEGHTSRTMSWEVALRDELASLKALRAWWSRATRSDTNPITLVTQATVDRLPQLAAQCASWGGRLSAALYLALPATPAANDVVHDKESDTAQETAWAADQQGITSRINQKDKARARKDQEKDGDKKLVQAQQRPAGARQDASLKEGGEGRKREEEERGVMTGVHGSIKRSSRSSGGSSSSTVELLVKYQSVRSVVRKRQEGAPGGAVAGAIPHKPAGSSAAGAAATSTRVLPRTVRLPTGRKVLATAAGAAAAVEQAAKQQPKPAEDASAGKAKEGLKVGAAGKQGKDVDTAKAAASGQSMSQGDRQWGGGAVAESMVGKALQAVSEMHARMEQLRAGGAGGCALDVVLVVEEVASLAQAHLTYPVNSLRNLARLQARTPLVALLDVDMLVSSSMVQWLAQAGNAAAMVQGCEQGTAYVLPAFETYGPNTSVAAELADQLAAASKSSLLRSVTRGLAGHFDSRRFPMGHAPTNFKQWFGSNFGFQVTYAYRYEPWVVVHRLLAPWHDARFRGYGNNKIEHVCNLNATGFQFVVHPSAFIVHRAHTMTRARTQLMSDMREYMAAVKQHKKPSNSSLYGHTKAMFEASKHQMDQSTFVPTVDGATARCVARLSWWGAEEQSGAAGAKGGQEKGWLGWLSGGNGSKSEHDSAGDAATQKGGKAAEWSKVVQHMKDLWGENGAPSESERGEGQERGKGGGRAQKGKDQQPVIMHPLGGLQVGL